MNLRSDAALTAMMRRGVSDPYQLLDALLHALREDHLRSALPAPAAGVRTGPGAATLAERVDHCLRCVGRANLSAADQAAAADRPWEADRLRWVGQGQAALADLLDYCLPGWDAERAEDRGFRPEVN